MSLVDFIVGCLLKGLFLLAANLVSRIERLNEVHFGFEFGHYATFHFC